MNLFEILSIIFFLLLIVTLIALSILLNAQKKNLKIINENKKNQEKLISGYEKINAEMKSQLKVVDEIINNIPYGIVILDSQYRIIKINDNLLNLLLLEGEKVIGSKTIFIFNNKNLEDLVSKTRKTGKSQSSKIIFYGDEEINFDIETVLLNTENYSILIIFNNTTQEFEFSKLRSQFVSNVSHEMRTPLTSIKGYIETAVDFDLDDKQTVKKYLLKALREVDRLNLLIEDILNLSSIEYKRNVIVRQPVEINSIIADVIDSLNHLVSGNNSEIFFKKSSQKIIINSDEELIRPLVRNMIENSIFHGGKGIEITIIAEDKESEIVLTFSDNGRGIESRDIPFIFQRFYKGRIADKSRRIGSGLGLAIVKHIVELHEGIITVSSVPEKETSFIITLPKDSLS